MNPHVISDPAVMQGQVERMLKDPRAHALVDNFAFSWLNLGTLAQVEPDDKSFTAEMRTNFETEARLFLGSVLLENRSVLDLINADWTYVNESLARQYDIPGVFGPQFRRERPQKGRLRQFYQFGAEVINDATAEADVELIVLLDTIYRQLDVTEYVIEINSVGCGDCRPQRPNVAASNPWSA